MSFFVSCYRLCFKAYVVWHKYYYPGFLLISICMEYLFLSSHFQAVCLWIWYESLIGNIYFLFCIHLTALCLLIGAYSPPTFKVIIIFKNIYLFTWLYWVFVADAGSSTLVVAHRIFSCTMQTLSHCVLDLVPWPGLKPGPPALRPQSHWDHEGSPHLKKLLKGMYLCYFVNCFGIVLFCLFPCDLKTTFSILSGFLPFFYFYSICISIIDFWFFGFCKVYI